MVLSWEKKTEKEENQLRASWYSGQRFFITSYITPRLITPSGTPKVIATSVSPRGYSAAASPRITSCATFPRKSQHEGRKLFSPWYPSSQQLLAANSPLSAANSPPPNRSMPGRTPPIDGKEFFCQARSHLSYGQFSVFPANIKELNAQKQTRDKL